MCYTLFFTFHIHIHHPVKNRQLKLFHVTEYVCFGWIVLLLCHFSCVGTGRADRCDWLANWLRACLHPFRANPEWESLIIHMHSILQWFKSIKQNHMPGSMNLTNAVHECALHKPAAQTEETSFDSICYMMPMPIPLLTATKKWTMNEFSMDLLITFMCAHMYSHTHLLATIYHA